MLKGFSVPMTPNGLASMVPTPPWHYVGTNMAVEFIADADKIAKYLPDGLEPSGGRCTAFFCDWQTASGEIPEAYLNPQMSQYKEAAIMMECTYKGNKAAFCPFIYVDNDGAAMRGQVYGYPKQLANIYITRTFGIKSKAAPEVAKGGKFAGYAAMDCGRIMDMQIELEEPTDQIAYPHFANVIGLRQFPNLRKADGYKPEILDLVVGAGGSGSAADMWIGKGKLNIYAQSQPELEDFMPLEVGRAFYQLDEHTLTDMKVLEDLR